MVSEQRFLGCFIGRLEGRETFVSAKVLKWKEDITYLSKIALSKPQATFVALTKSLQFQWHYLQRTVPDYDSLFVELEDIISMKFLSAVLGRKASPEEHELFPLSAHMGGLEIVIPTKSASDAYATHVPLGPLSKLMLMP